ncbi:MAG TPA: DUF2335 domain-containing protein [Dehalococcoidia bacterium]
MSETELMPAMRRCVLPIAGEATEVFDLPGMLEPPRPEPEVSDALSGDWRVVGDSLRGNLWATPSALYTTPMGTTSKTAPTVIRTQIEAWLPDPGILAAYDEIVPGSAEHILAMVELEQQHRHRHDNRELWLSLFSRVTVVLMALMVLSIALVMALLGQSLLGLGTLLAALATFTRPYLRRHARPGGSGDAV